MKFDISTHLIPTTGTRNTRDLGGYPTKDGKTTKNNVFFRSDSSSLFTAEDISLLAQRNLGLVLDLRADDETTKSPSAYADGKGIRYENVQLIDNINSHFNPAEMPKSMGALYIYFLDRAQKSMTHIFNILSETAAKGQSSLFHCAVGKDRTGTVAMMLLDLAGVPDEVIVEDYAATYNFMKPVFDKQVAEYKAQGIDVPEFTFRSDAQNMIETLDHLHSTYGNAREYLLEAGVLKDNLDNIVNAFI